MSVNSYQFQPKGPGPHRGDWLRKYGNLPPDQQEQQLKQDPAFQKLSPEKQNKLLERLRNFNSQPPEKKAKILDRMETYEHMTPEQQASARNLFDRYHSLPEDQREKVSQAYRRLRGMPPDAAKPTDEFRRVPQQLHRGAARFAARDDRSKPRTEPLKTDHSARGGDARLGKIV